MRGGDDPILHKPYSPPFPLKILFIIKKTSQTDITIWKIYKN